MNTELRNDVYSDDDEIDLIELIRFIMSKWKIWVGTSALLGLVTLIYVMITPPIYESWTTFFVPSDGNSALSKYASFLGAPTSGNLEDQVLSIFQSERLKWAISEKVYEIYPDVFESAIHNIALETGHALTDKEKIGIVKGKLEFNRQFNVSKDKSGLFKMSAENAHPDVSLLVIQTALTEVAIVYNELEIGAKKRIITVLDSPTLKKNPVKPKKMLMLVVSIITGGFLGVMISFLQSFWVSYKQKN